MHEVALLCQDADSRLSVHVYVSAGTEFVCDIVSVQSRVYDSGERRKRQAFYLFLTLFESASICVMVS